jgi:hypothetical protein
MGSLIYVIDDLTNVPLGVISIEPCIGTVLRVDVETF